MAKLVSAILTKHQSYVKGMVWIFGAFHTP